MKRILIVDDDKAILEILQEFLQLQGHAVCIAEKTLDALMLFGKNKIDLVISDFQIDERNGFDLSKKILEIDPNVPIIVMSGNIDSKTESKLLNIGVRYVLSKPVRLSELRGYIKLCFLPDP